MEFEGGGVWPIAGRRDAFHYVFQENFSCIPVVVFVVMSLLK